MTFQREDELIRDAINGDPKATDLLCKQKRPEAYKICFSLLRNHDDAEDATQMALCTLSIKIISFKSLSKFSTWFYTVCMNESITILRRRKTEFVNDKALRVHLHPHSRQGSSDVDPNILQLRYYNRIIELLHDHPGCYVAFLKDYEGRSWEEIAMITKWTAGAARANYRSFCKKARQIDTKTSD